MNKEEKKAIKLAIECMKDVRRRKYAVSANIYKKFHAESQEDQAKKYDELTNAISIMEKILNVSYV